MRSLAVRPNAVSAVRLLLLVLCGALLAVAGCEARLDADGSPITGRVWFDQKGVAHCPFCEPEKDLARLPTDAASAPVKPFSNRCTVGHDVVWAADDVPCGACDGSGVCTDCFGAGVDSITKKSCPGCMALDANRLTRSQGLCYACEGDGMVRYGWHGPNATRAGL